MLASRRLTIVGDSLSKQHAISLFCALFSVVDKRATLAGAKQNRSEHAYYLRRGGIVSFVFNDRLLDARKEPGEVWAAAPPSTVDRVRDGRRDESWASRLRRGPAGMDDVVIFATGLHWNAAIAPGYPAMVRAVLSELFPASRPLEPAADAAAPGLGAPFLGTFVYRSNFVPGCSAERRPSSYAGRHAAVLGREVEPARPRRPAPPPRPLYNWGHLLPYDAVWATELAAAPREHRRRLHVLNVTELTSLRGDAHCERCGSRSRPNQTSDSLDCLHFCLTGSGPIDAWSVLLQEEVLRPLLHDRRRRRRFVARK